MNTKRKKKTLVMGHRGDGTYDIMDYVGIKLSDFTEEMLIFFRGMNIIPGVWCVDDRETALKLIDSGVDIITSNSPDIIINAIRDRGHE